MPKKKNKIKKNNILNLGSSFEVLQKNLTQKVAKKHRSSHICDVKSGFVPYL